ncbi:MAG: hypothetical protein AAB215_05030 [Planctomycetota bacterium]
MFKTAARTAWRTALLLTFLLVCHLAPRIKASENAIGAPRGLSAASATAVRAETSGKTSAVSSPGSPKSAVPAKRFRVRK